MARFPMCRSGSLPTPEWFFLELLTLRRGVQAVKSSNNSHYKDGTAESQIQSEETGKTSAGTMAHELVFGVCWNPCF